ncbi:hypothetical protein HPP92_020506 [Vanilla planifolia]|uniref:Uncharacterized protein n=1 Tax=Vanilla planifolia TaxID=51239 RepID=A0A835UJX9_VANPL|nr:hypothetical protein HPP92_020506 [Vanilla planifolia]
MATPETALNKIERAHQMYRESKHRDALVLYTEALSMAKNKAQKIAVHSNRAACYLKLHDFKKAAQECTSVLELDQQHTGALMLRAQTLVALKEYQSALFDVNRLMELNSSSDVYKNLQARLRTQLSLAPIPETDDEPLHYDEDDDVTTRKEDRWKMAPCVTTVSPVMENRNVEIGTVPHPEGWRAITQPKGHSGLDYSRWDRVEDDSSEDEDDEGKEELPQYRFRVRNVGVGSFK